MVTMIWGKARAEGGNFRGGKEVSTSGRSILTRVVWGEGRGGRRGREEWMGE